MKIFKIYDIGLQRYKDYKIKACDKNVTPLALKGIFTEFQVTPPPIVHCETALQLKFALLYIITLPLYLLSNVTLKKFTIPSIPSISFRLYAA